VKEARFEPPEVIAGFAGSATTRTEVDGLRRNSTLVEHAPPPLHVGSTTQS
jgi:hypothetical protein